MGISLIELVSGSYGFYGRKNKEEKLFYQSIIGGKKEFFWELLEINSNKIFSEEFKNLCFDMISKDPSKRPKIQEILNHKWFGNIPQITDKELEIYETEIKLKEELNKRFKKAQDFSIVELNQINSNNNIIVNKFNTKSLSDNENIYFKSDAKADFIDTIKFMNYYINIRGHINPVNFMNKLCAKIDEKFNDENWSVFVDKKINELKFDLIKYNNESEEENSEENDLSMKVILYETSGGYLLRCLKNKINKNDFIDKFGIIPELVKKLFE